MYWGQREGGGAGRESHLSDHEAGLTPVKEGQTLGALGRRSLELQGNSEKGFVRPRRSPCTSLLGKAPHLSKVWVCPASSPAFFSWLQQVRPQLETMVNPKLQQLGSSVHMLLGQKIWEAHFYRTTSNNVKVLTVQIWQWVSSPSLAAVRDRKVWD